MKEITKTSPRNSLILVMDKSAGQLPDSMSGKLVSATDTCVVVGTLSELDGETEIALTDQQYIGKEDDILVYDGSIKTPGKALSVCTVMNDPLMTIEASEVSKVSIFVNDGYEPDRITIVVGIIS